MIWCLGCVVTCFTIVPTFYETENLILQFNSGERPDLVLGVTVILYRSHWCRILGRRERADRDIYCLPGESWMMRHWLRLRLWRMRVCGGRRYIGQELALRDTERPGPRSSDAIWVSGCGDAGPGSLAAHTDIHRGPGGRPVTIISRLSSTFYSGRQHLSLETSIKEPFGWNKREEKLKVFQSQLKLLEAN